jgi:hypothetical protein
MSHQSEIMFKGTGTGNQTADQMGGSLIVNLNAIEPVAKGL